MKRALSWLLAVAGLLGVVGAARADLPLLTPLFLTQLFGQEATPAGEPDRTQRRVESRAQTVGEELQVMPKRVVRDCDDDCCCDVLWDCVGLLAEHAPVVRLLLFHVGPTTPYHFAAGAALDVLSAMSDRFAPVGYEPVEDAPACCKESPCRGCEVLPCPKMVGTKYVIGPNGPIVVEVQLVSDGAGGLAPYSCTKAGYGCGTYPPCVAEGCDNEHCCQAAAVSAKECKCCEKCSDCKDCKCKTGAATVVTVGRVIIVGNTVTKDDVIRRIIGICPGQVLRFPELRIAEQNLARLGIQSDPAKGSHPSVQAIDTDDPNVKDVLVTVRETRTGTFRIGAGFNTNNGLVGNIVLNERNMDCNRNTGAAAAVKDPGVILSKAPFCCDRFICEPFQIVGAQPGLPVAMPPCLPPMHPSFPIGFPVPPPPLPHAWMPPMPHSPLVELAELNRQRAMISATIEHIEAELERLAQAESQQRVVMQLATMPVAHNAHKVHLVTEHFEAHCESMCCVSGDPHRLMLQGDVCLTCKRSGHTVRIEAPCAVVNMKDGTFTVESRTAVPPPACPVQDVRYQQYTPGYVVPTYVPAPPVRQRQEYVVPMVPVMPVPQR